jgi:hypothetical protein
MKIKKPNLAITKNKKGPILNKEKKHKFSNKIFKNKTNQLWNKIKKTQQVLL